MELVEHHLWKDFHELLYIRIVESRLNANRMATTSCERPRSKSCTRSIAKRSDEEIRGLDEVLDPDSAYRWRLEVSVDGPGTDEVSGRIRVCKATKEPLESGDPGEIWPCVGFLEEEEWVESHTGDP